MSTYDDGGLREEGRQALLAYFRLEALADELPVERLRTMSPSALHALAVRSANEPLDPPISDRIGDRIPATLAA